VFTLQLAVITS